MTIKNSIFYWAVCDNCGVRPYVDDGDPHVLRTRNEAETKAFDRGWTTDSHGHHYCWDCAAPPVELAP